MGSHQSSFGGGSIDAFLVKFNSSGICQWGTYYGGSGGDQGKFCATDASGNVYIAGYTYSGTSIATIGSHQSVGGGATYDAFLVKFNSAGIRQWGTYYGGSEDDYGNSCATDAAGNVYMAGWTDTPSGTSIATSGSHQSAFGGIYDAFLVKFNSAGIRQWGTYYGGDGGDREYSCATDASGNVYMAGHTWSSSNIATSGSHQSVGGGATYDAFLVKFNSAGIRQWGTYYGDTTNTDFARSCATDASGNVYLSGCTNSSLNIATTGCHQSSFGGVYDAFLVQFNSSGVRQWGTYYGGSGDDEGNSCATDASGNVYMAGWTNTPSGTSIATAGSHQSANGGNADAFLVKFIDCVSPPTITVNSGVICAGQSFTINPTGANTYTIQGGSAVVSPSINTTYTVIGTSTAGCVSQAFATSSLTVNECVGITNQNMGLGGEAIYPNPNNGEFTIESQLAIDLIIINELGQTIKNIQLSSANNLQVKVSDLANGIYFIVGKNKTTNINQKIIVNK